MPRLTDLVAGHVEHAQKDECPRCQKRKATVYVQARALRYVSDDPAKIKNHSGPAGSKKTYVSSKGVTLCRNCAREVVEGFAQLLGTEVRHGEVD